MGSRLFVLRQSACCPGPRRYDERCCREHLAAEFAQLSTPLIIETSRVLTCGADAERERLPPIFEVRMLDAD
jgi:hypothetical protein